MEGKKGVCVAHVHRGTRQLNGIVEMCPILAVSDMAPVAESGLRSGAFQLS